MNTLMSQLSELPVVRPSDYQRNDWPANPKYKPVKEFDPRFLEGEASSATSSSSSSASSSSSSSSVSVSSSAPIPATPSASAAAVAPSLASDASSSAPPAAPADVSATPGDFWAAVSVFLAPLVPEAQGRAALVQALRENYARDMAGASSDQLDFLLRQAQFALGTSADTSADTVAKPR